MPAVEAAPSSFTERANALAELGMSSQELGDVHLMAHRLCRAGWSENDAEYAVIRMQRRQAALADAQRFFADAAGARMERLVVMLTKDDPPPWRAIGVLALSIVRARLRGLVNVFKH